MELRPRISLSSSSSSPSWSLPIRAPLTFDEEDDDGSGSDYGPRLPRIKLSSPTSCSSRSSEAGETASGGTSVADPVEETDQIDDGSPKDWILRPFVPSSGGNSGDPEDVVWEFEEGSGRAGAVVPIARLSMEFDVDDEEEIEEDGFLARVPGFCVGDGGGYDEGSELKLRMKSLGGEDWKQSEVLLEVNECEALSSSASEDEMSATKGVARGINGGGNKSAVEMKPCGSDDQNRSEISEVSGAEDLSVKDTAPRTYVSDDYTRESEGVTYGITEVEMTLSQEMKSSFEDGSALLGESVAEKLSTAGALETTESSMEEISFESSRVMEVNGSWQSLGVIPIDEVVVQDLDAEENAFVENTEVGMNASDFVDGVVSSCYPRPKQARENERNSVSDSEPEGPILDGVQLIDVLEDASLSWVSSLTSDIEKIVDRDRNSERYEPSDGVQAQVFGSKSAEELTTEESYNLEKIELLKVKFQRLLDIIGCSHEDSVGARVIRRLILGLGENSDLSLNIIVLGKSGVGKSSTINSILGEQKAPVDPLGPGTANINEILGTVCGIKVRILDTPGLRVAGMEQALNRGMLSAVRKYTAKFPPDVVLYVDRLDSSARDFDDHPILQMITRFLGPSIWEKAIVTMTHAASFLSPDGQYGSTLSYEAFLEQRLNVIRSCINRVTGLVPIPPMCLVDNNCGQEVLPNGERWRLQLLLLCCSIKVMDEARSWSKPCGSFSPWALFGNRVDDWKRNITGAKQGSTGVVCDPRDGIILDILTDSSLYANHGELELSSLKLKVRHLGQHRAQTCLRLWAGEDEHVDADRPAIRIPYQADLKLTMDSPLMMEVGGDSNHRADLQSQFSLGQSSSKLDVLVGFRDKQRWKITLRTSSSDSPWISFFGFILPIAASFFQFLAHAHKPH